MSDAMNFTPDSTQAVLLHHQINQFNAAYADALDSKRFEEWPLFFTEDGRYTLQARENHERNLPLALMDLESRAMMRDRVYGITQTIYHGPYYTRHLVGQASVSSFAEGVILATANYAVFRTKPGGAGAGVSEVMSVGRYIDSLIQTPSGLKLQSRCCVYYSETVLNSVIYPI